MQSCTSHPVSRLCSWVPQQSEPALASYMHSNILMHKTLEKSMAFLLANKLASDTLLATGLMRVISEAYAGDEVNVPASYILKLLVAGFTWGCCWRPQSLGAFLW